jgi:peptidoglycan/LPS O-acetylase OafA/YrhL
VARDSFPYRRDIDGLRAVAVLAVVLYHAHVPLFGGGYVGVDVFFVISGFLITSILLPNAQAGRLGLALFYERRIRRIFPALFAVLGASFIAAWWLFLPDQFETLGRAAMSATLFVSNIFFRRQATGYFTSSHDPSPLLHTWSLAVEEQFYIVYPVCLFIAFRLSARRAPLILAAVLIASFAASIWAIGHHPQGAFYRSSLRAWELLIGALLALDVMPVPARLWHREAMAGLGSALLLWSILTYTSATPFPGLPASAPCLGGALIIYAGIGGQTVVGRTLAIRPLVWIGLTSYSLYLWHWPILVFAGQYIGTLNGGVTAGAILASIAISALSWRFIEQPFRRPKALRRRTAFSLAVGAMAATMTVAGFILATGGLPSRLPKDVTEIADAARDSEPRLDNCSKAAFSNIERRQLCTIANSGAGSPSFILWGDSHAGALIPAAEAAAERHDVNGVFADREGCPPLIGVSVSGWEDPADCRRLNDLILDYVRKAPSIRTVILAARWAAYSEGSPYLDEIATHFGLRDDEAPPGTKRTRHQVFARGLARTLAAVEQAGKQVVVVGPVPEIGLNVPKWLAIQKWTGHDRSVAPTRRAFLSRQEFVLATLGRLEGRPGVTVIYPDHLLCPGRVCRIADGTHPYYFDDDHLSVHGALAVSSVFDPVMDALTSKPVAEEGGK